MGSDLDYYGHVTLIFTLSRKTHYLSKLCLLRLKSSYLKPSSVTANEMKKVAMVVHGVLFCLSEKKFRFQCKMFVTAVVENDNMIINIHIL